MALIWRRRNRSPLLTIRSKGAVSPNGGATLQPLPISLSATNSSPRCPMERTHYSPVTAFSVLLIPCLRNKANKLVMTTLIAAPISSSPVAHPATPAIAPVIAVQVVLLFSISLFVFNSCRILRSQIGPRVTMLRHFEPLDGELALASLWVSMAEEKKQDFSSLQQTRLKHDSR